MSISSPPIKSALTVLSTGNEELDNRLGGGLPLPSLIVLEGDSGTGKTVICNQISYGLTSAGRKVLYVTTENTVKNFLEQAINVRYDLTTPYVKGLLAIVPAHLEGIKWCEEGVNKVVEALTNFLKLRSKKYDCIIVDSVSMLARYLSISNFYNFLTELRVLARDGKLVLITIHPEIVSKEVMKVATSTSDVYLRLAHAEIGGRAVKVINVVKIRGAPTLAESAIAFDVDPAFGIKIIPLALAKA